MIKVETEIQRRELSQILQVNFNKLVMVDINHLPFYCASIIGKLELTRDYYNVKSCSFQLDAIKKYELIGELLRLWL